MKRLLLGLFGAISSLSTVAASEVTVAVIGPMSGRLAEFGAQMRAGVEQAAADINATGGVLGHQVELHFEDDRCDPATAVAAAARVASKKVHLVVGHFCSRASIPASKLYANAGIVQISPASTNPKFTDQRAGPEIFRLSGRDDQQGEIAAAYLAKQSSRQPIAILHDKSSFGQRLANQTHVALKASRVRQLIYEPIGADIKSLGTRMKAAGVKSIYFAGDHTKAAGIIRELRKQGMGTQLIGSDALATQSFWQATGVAGEGTLMTHLWDPRSSPAAKAVVAKLRARRIEPEGYVLYAYAALETWAQAATEAGSFQARAVADKLGSMKVSTVLGSFGFNESGDPDRSFYRLYRWQAGRFQLLD